MIEMNQILARSLRGAAALLALLALAGNAIAQNGWTERKEDDGVKVYTRKVPGSDFDAFRGVTTLRANQNDLTGFMEDIPNYVNWSYNIIDARVIKENIPGDLVIYMVQKTPVVNNRDLSLHVTSKNMGGGVVKITIKEDLNAIPKNDKYVRVPKFDGSYVFTPLGDGQIRVEYEATVDPGGKIPAFIGNAFAVDVPLNTLKNMRKVDFTKWAGKNKFVPQ